MNRSDVLGEAHLPSLRARWPDRGHNRGRSQREAPHHHANQREASHFHKIVRASFNTYRESTGNDLDQYDAGLNGYIEAGRLRQTTLLPKETIATNGK
jgi:hypothetical protein